jgi:hypothetical protein
MVLTKDGICTLANVYETDLLSQFRVIERFVMSNVIQAQEKGYHNQHPIDQFLLLVIEIFESLCKRADVFVYYCANVIWSFKGLEGLPLSILITFLKKKISVIW